MDRFENIPETALRWHQEGKGAVLAAVVEELAWDNSSWAFSGVMPLAARLRT